MTEKIIVTGAGGFIGSHLVETCVENGYTVKAFVHYNSQNSWGWLDTSDIKSEVEIVSGDIRDYDSVYDAVQGCIWVFHLAALIGIPYSYVSPLAYVKTNIEGTYNVLQASRKAGVTKIVHTSTSEVYGTAQFVPISEKHPINPQSPYAASKASADYIALSFFRSFGLPVTILRPFNTYGPRQSARAIIPTVITQILDEKKRIKLGSIHPSRDLTFVKDTARGFLAAGEAAGVEGEIINTGMKAEITIGDLAGLIAKIMDVEIDIECEEKRQRPDKSEVERLLADPDKAAKLLNWTPEFNLETGIQETVNWFRKNQAIYKSDIYNV